MADFLWGSGGQKITTPEQAKRQRDIAAALLERAPSENWAEGLGSITAALASNSINDRASTAEEEGAARAGGLFSNLAINSDPNAIIAALTNPDAAWASPAQTSIASALLNSGLERSDPMYQLQMQTAQAELDRLRNPAPDYPTSVQEYLYAQNDPGFASWQAENGGGQTINVGGAPANIGTIPPGYAAVEDPTSPAGYRFEVIPNSAPALEAEAAAAAAGNAQGSRDVATNTIVTAADQARKAYNSGAWTGGTVGNVMANIPESQAAEVRRQTDVLKANATVQNIQAMRNASPTGAALGALSDKEGALLVAVTGALDPASPNYPQQLDQYERTMLELVHGPELGKQIYDETRTGGAQWQDMGNGVRIREIPQ